MLRLTLVIVLTPLLLNACSTKAKYACGVPNGVGCQSISRVYENSQTSIGSTVGGSTVGGSKVGRSMAAPAAVNSSLKKGPHRKPMPLPSKREVEQSVVNVEAGAPLYIPPRRVRIWVSQWVDKQNVLHDETYLYMIDGEGRWSYAR